MSESFPPFSPSEPFPRLVYEKLLPHAAAEFESSITRIQGQPRPMSLEDVHAMGTVNPAKSITQGYINVIESELRDRPNDRLYALTQAAGESLRSKTQSLGFSRTVIGETSAHKVFFVKLSGGGGSVRVAVKHFGESDKGSGRESLLKEWVNMQLAAERGFGAFKPAGFITTEEGGYLLTKRRDDFEPLDNDNWTTALQEPESHKNLLGIVKQLGPLLADLHGKGGFHGDPQVKNFGVTERGDIEIIDWEAATFVRPPTWGEDTEKREESLRSQAERDLKVLFGSLARSVELKGVGLLDNLLPSVQWVYFKEYVMTPYIDKRLHNAEEAGQSVEELLNHLGEIEATMHEYINDGELYRSLARTRRRILLQEQEEQQA